MSQTQAHLRPLCLPVATPVEMAAYDLLHSYQSGDATGAAALAPKIGKVPAVLSNECNPNSQSHKLGLRDAVLMELSAGKADILHAHAKMLGHVCIDLPHPSVPIGDVEILTMFARWQAAIGITCQKIHAALEDGRITHDEYNSIRNAGFEEIREFLMFLQRVGSLAE